MPHHDLAVIGAGVMGLAATAAAVARGLDAICLEAGEPAGEQSRGEGRIFRVAHERPELCESALRALGGWEAWERSAGVPLLDRCGLIVLGAVARGRHDAMVAAGAAAELGDLRALAHRAPQLRADDDAPALWDPLGASIRTGSVTRWLLAALGGRVRRRARVTGASRAADRWELAIGDERVSARSVVVCAGVATPAVAGLLGVEIAPDPVETGLRLTFAARGAAGAPCTIDRRDPELGAYSLPTRRGYSVGAGAPDEDGCREYARRRLAGLSLDAVTERVECDYADASLPGGEGWRIHAGDGVRALVTAHAYKFAPLLAGELLDGVLDPPAAVNGRR